MDDVGNGNGEDDWGSGNADQQVAVAVDELFSVDVAMTSVFVWTVAKNRGKMTKIPTAVRPTAKMATKSIPISWMPLCFGKTLG